MDGIERIIAIIEGDALKKTGEIKAAADLRCSALRAEYNKTAQDRYLQTVREGAEDCDLHVKRMEKAAAIEAKKSILSLKQEMVDRALLRAQQMLRDLREDEYAALLARLAGGAARTGHEEVIVCPGDSGSVAERAIKAANEHLVARGLPGRLRLSRETREISGGLVLKDGDTEINCSFTALTGMIRGNMAAQVAEAMFG